jgi:uncharacterized membrane protein
MDTTKRITAFIAYLLPVIGWIYIWGFQPKNEFARFHLKQAIGLVLYLIAVVIGWVVVAWIITWIPYGFILAMSLFTVLMVAFIVGLVAWLTGLLNALNGRVANLPLFGQQASRFPF